MVARHTGASLGLLAFTITAVVGLIVGNPVTATLSRSILALFVFCLIGSVVGAAARLAVTEHAKQRREDIHARYREPPPTGETVSPESGDGAETARTNA
ncbi:MAG: hypothetical protein ACE5E6_06405 [Phycisphaerae bacterium]